MDPANGNARERLTKIVPLAGHLLAQVTRVDDNRPIRHSVGTMPGTTRPVWPDRWGGSLGRRHVCQSKKGGALVGPTQCGKGTKIMVLTDAQGTPLFVEIHSASPAEVTLIESLLARRQLRCRPKRLIYDRAADSDPLRQRLSRQGIDLDLPTPQEPPPSTAARRSPAAPLPPPPEDRTHPQWAAKLPTAGRPLQISR